MKAASCASIMMTPRERCGPLQRFRDTVRNMRVHNLPEALHGDVSARDWRIGQQFDRFVGTHFERVHLSIWYMWFAKA